MLARDARLGHGRQVGVRSLLLAAAALMLAPGAADARGPAGRYRLVGEQDVASELLLKPDGRFEYALAAGALDERAEGRWTLQGKSVRLTTEPKPKPAMFSAGAATRSNEAPLTLRAVWPDGRGIAGIDFRIGFDAGDPVEDYTQEDGWSMPAEEKRVPRWVQLELRMYNLASPRFPIDASAANALTFTLTPNDLGVFDFQGTMLDVSDAGLRMHRGPYLLVYRREPPRRR
jgi:hypothetical protein